MPNVVSSSKENIRFISRGMYGKLYQCKSIVETSNDPNNPNQPRQVQTKNTAIKWMSRSLSHVNEATVKELIREVYMLNTLNDDIKSRVCMQGYPNGCESVIPKNKPNFFEDYCLTCREKRILRRVVMKNGDATVTFENVVSDDNRRLSQEQPMMNLHLSMEYFNQNLENFKAWRDLQAKVSLTPHEIHFIMHELALGLSVLHGKGIIHRDLSMNNVLVNVNQFTDNTIFYITKVVICDYGQARLMNERAYHLVQYVVTDELQRAWDPNRQVKRGDIIREQRKALTHTTYLGKLNYRPPENLYGGQHADYDQSWDIWQMGVLYLSLLTDNLQHAYVNRKFMTPEEYNYVFQQQTPSPETVKDIIRRLVETYIGPPSLEELQEMSMHYPSKSDENLAYEYQNIQQHKEYIDRRTYYFQNTIPARLEDNYPIEYRATCKLKSCGSSNPMPGSIEHFRLLFLTNHQELSQIYGIGSLKDENLAIPISNNQEFAVRALPVIVKMLSYSPKRRPKAADLIYREEFIYNNTPWIANSNLPTPKNYNLSSCYSPNPLIPGSSMELPVRPARDFPKLYQPGMNHFKVFKEYLMQTYSKNCIIDIVNRSSTMYRVGNMQLVLRLVRQLLSLDKFKNLCNLQSLEDQNKLIPEFNSVMNLHALTAMQALFGDVMDSRSHYGEMWGKLQKYQQAVVNNAESNEHQVFYVTFCSQDPNSQLEYRNVGHIYDQQTQNGVMREYVTLGVGEHRHTQSDETILMMVIGLVY